MGFLECNVCFKSYNHSFNKPLVISCGHTFCNACITALIQSSPQCPTCRKKFLDQKIDMMPTNWEIFNMMDELDGKVSKKNSTIICQKHPSEAIRYLCTSCHVWVCDKCKTNNHQESNCNVLDTAEAVKKEKESMISSMKKEKDILNAKEIKLKEELQKLNANRDYVDVSLHELVSKRSVITNLEDDIRSLEKTPDSIQKVIEINQKLNNFSMKNKEILLSSYEEIAHLLEVRRYIVEKYNHIYFKRLAGIIIKQY